MGPSWGEEGRDPPPGAAIGNYAHVTFQSPYGHQGCLPDSVIDVSRDDADARQVNETGERVLSNATTIALETIQRRPPRLGVDHGGAPN